MKRKLTQPIQYTYSNTFRNMYSSSSPQKNIQLNTHRLGKTANHVLLQYQPASQTIPVSPDRKAATIGSGINSNYTLQNYTKRLHSNQKKYSFSAFVKKGKKKSEQLKNNKKKLQISELTLWQQKIKAKQKFSNILIKKLYNDFSKTESIINPGKKFVVAEIKQSNLLPTNMSYSYRQATYAPKKKSQATQHKTHFFKTLPYGRRLSSSERQYFKPIPGNRLKNQKFISPQLCHTQSFFHIEKCSPQNIDESFLRECEDFKQILLQQRLLRDCKRKGINGDNNFIKLLNKSKDENVFSKYVGSGRGNKHVAELRDARKIRKMFGVNDGSESPVDRISPW